MTCGQKLWEGGFSSLCPSTQSKAPRTHVPIPWGPGSTRTPQLGALALTPACPGPGWLLLLPQESQGLACRDQSCQAPAASVTHTSLRWGLRGSP